VTTLLVGQGLLGSRLRHLLERRGEDVRVAAVPWGDAEAALAALLRAAADAGPDWRLAWCAGAAVVGADTAATDAEVELVRRFLAEVAQPPQAALLASSAGGVYAGSAGPPFTESHDAHPTSPYGRAKLDIESAFRSLAAAGTRLVIGRLANLYGPGQDLGKQQGLVSQLCLSRLTGRPLGIYVSVDTLRDYVYVDDAAAVAAALLDRVADEVPGTVVVKIVATGRSTSVAGLVSAATRAFRRRPPVVYAARSGSGQVRDLRLRSHVWTDLDELVTTPLVVGLRATAEDIAARHRQAGLVLTP
jgi:UDP-glucose 4-epimerase